MIQQMPPNSAGIGLGDLIRPGSWKASFSMHVIEMEACSGGW
jgi:hypothetical protein